MPGPRKKPKDFVDPEAKPKPKVKKVAPKVEPVQESSEPEPAASIVIDVFDNARPRVKFVSFRPSGVVTARQLDRGRRALSRAYGIYTARKRRELAAEGKGPKREDPKVQRAELEESKRRLRQPASEETVALSSEEKR